MYPEAFRRKVAEEYYAGGVSQRELMRRYGIRSKGAIARWLHELGYRHTGAAKPIFEATTHTAMALPLCTTGSEDPAELQRRILELQQLLRDEQLRSEAYRRMIEKAEKELNIPIRKKSSTK